MTIDWGHMPAQNTLTEHELVDLMRGQVAHGWLPDAAAFVDQVPLTGTGKLWKMKLREQFRDDRLPG